MSYDDVAWRALRSRILERDGNRCRNCGSDKELTVHHWRPIAAEIEEGTSTWGYSQSKNPLLVADSGLVTVCRICHGSLEAARRRISIRDDVSQLGTVSVPERDWHNIFELWDKNGRTIPFKAIKNSWQQSATHFMLVDEVEVRNWPYGFAWGRYVLNGEVGEEQKIGSAGIYTWRLVE